MNKLRVLIAEDHPFVRVGIRALAQRIAGVEVVAEAGDGNEALRLIREVEPDLVLLDISMPGTGGFDVLRQTSKDFPDVRVIVLTLHHAGEYAIRALDLGARGYVLKSAAGAELEQAMEAVRRGQTYVSPQISKEVLLDYAQRPLARSAISIDRPH